jgi:hypothetical protein
MDMGAALGAFKHSCSKKFVFAERLLADGTNPFCAALNAVTTSADAHQAVISPGYGRVNLRFDKVALAKRR